jgi:hypothetical protein
MYNADITYGKLNRYYLGMPTYSQTCFPSHLLPPSEIAILPVLICQNVNSEFFHLIQTIGDGVRETFLHF